MFALFLLVVLLAAESAGRGKGSGDLVTDAVIIGIALVLNVIAWLVTRWQVSDGVLRIETGLVRRQSRRFPLSQVQAIDIVQSGIARVFGLAELRLRMAASGASGGRLACLSLSHAEELRRQLLSLGRGVHAPAGHEEPQASVPAPVIGPDGLPAFPPQTPGTERVLFEVQPLPFTASIFLTKFGVTALMAVGLLIGLMVAHVAAFAGIAVAWLFSVVLQVWRRYNGGYGTVVTDTRDGLRIQSGIVQTATETIRPGRVQAVLLVEPLVWRLLGWCRVEVDVAGPSQRKENRAEAARLRAVVPVGSRAQAARLLDELAPGRPTPSRRPPKQARWKAPFSYHFLAWGVDDTYVVASKGRLCRTTTWVPLRKVQSVRSVQGPWQRALGLGTVLVDTAGRRVHAVLRDRSEDEVVAAMATLPASARTARETEPGPGRR